LAVYDYGVQWDLKVQGSIAGETRDVSLDEVSVKAPDHEETSIGEPGGG
jgi:hypothetical protein